MDARLKFQTRWHFLSRSGSLIREDHAGCPVVPLRPLLDVSSPCSTLISLPSGSSCFAEGIAFWGSVVFPVPSTPVSLLSSTYARGLPSREFFPSGSELPCTWFSGIKPWTYSLLLAPPYPIFVFARSMLQVFESLFPYL